MDLQFSPFREAPYVGEMASGTLFRCTGGLVGLRVDLEGEKLSLVLAEPEGVTPRLEFLAERRGAPVEGSVELRPAATFSYPARHAQKGVIAFVGDQEAVILTPHHDTSRWVSLRTGLEVTGTPGAAFIDWVLFHEGEALVRGNGFTRDR